MARKARRHFDYVDKKALLYALETARRACVQANRKVPIRGEVYLASEKVMDAIDDAALVPTGRRDHFWLKGHLAAGLASEQGQWSGFFLLDARRLSSASGGGEEDLLRRLSWIGTFRSGLPALSVISYSKP